MQLILPFTIALESAVIVTELMNSYPNPMLSVVSTVTVLSLTVKGF